VSLFSVLYRVLNTKVKLVTYPCKKCSKTALTGETWFHCESGCIPGDANRWLPRQEANSSPTGPVILCSGKRMQEASQDSPPPPSNSYTPYRIQAVCRNNLWTPLRIELGQEGWLKQPVAKVRGPILACDQGSRRGHQCSETALTGETWFHCWEWVHPGDTKRWAPRQEANGLPTRPVTL
jgi:hypothetical protein